MDSMYVVRGARVFLGVTSVINASFQVPTLWKTSWVPL